MLNDRGPADRAIRAMRDCGVIRAAWDRSIFAQLFRHGYAHAAKVPGLDGRFKRDYSLTAAGLALAATLKPWAETR